MDFFLSLALAYLTLIRVAVMPFKPRQSERQGPGEMAWDGWVTRKAAELGSRQSSPLGQHVYPGPGPLTGT